MIIRVFYGGLLHKEFTFQTTVPWPMTGISTSLLAESIEIYNEAYCHITHPVGFIHGWYRADATPVHTSDVPKDIQALLLIL